MKRVVSLLFFLSSLIFAGNSIKLFPNSWQMIGVGFDYNLSRDLPYGSDDFKIVWHYKDGHWKAFSKDSSTASLIKDKNLWGDIVEKNSAFWILPKKELTYKGFKDKIDTINVKPGWNMVGITNWIEKQYGMSRSGFKSYFAYRDGSWTYLYKNHNGEYQGNLNAISFNEGAWIYNNTNQEKPLKEHIVEHYWDANIANKKFELSNGKYFILDQNGTVVSDDSKLSGRRWRAFRVKDNYMDFGLINNSSIISYRMSYNGREWSLYRVSEKSVRFLPSNVMVVNSVLTDKNISTMSVADSRKDVNIVANVKSAMDSIKNLLTNGDDDPDDVISNAKTTLGNYPNDNDAKVALAFISIVETMNDPIIGDSADINGSNLKISSFFQALKNYGGDIPDDAIKFASNIGDYNQNAKSILQSLSTHLKNSADKLGTIDDKNYIFNYAPLTDNKKLNYVDIKALQAMMYLLSSKLQLLSSYQLGNNDWLKENSENNIEYVKASVDPVGFFNSRNFFVNPSQNGLNQAKSLLLNALESYDTILKNHWYDKGLLFSGDELTAQKESEMKREIYLAIKNLNGKIPSFCLIDENLDFNINQNRYNDTIEKQYIDLSSLFDVDRAIKATDFPNLSYNGTLDEEKSKEYNSPVDANGNDLDIKYPDNINSYMKNLILDNQDRTYTTMGDYDFGAFGYGWYIRNSDSRYHGNKVEKIDDYKVRLTAYYRASSPDSNGDSRARMFTRLNEHPARKISMIFSPVEFLNAPNSRPKIQLAGSTWEDSKNGGLFIYATILGNHPNRFCYGFEADVGNDYKTTDKCNNFDSNLSENHRYKISITKIVNDSGDTGYYYELFDMDNSENRISSGTIVTSDLNENTTANYKEIYGDNVEAKSFTKMQITVKNDDANNNQSDFKTVADIVGVTIEKDWW